MERRGVGGIKERMGEGEGDEDDGKGGEMCGLPISFCHLNISVPSDAKEVANHDR